MDPFTSAALRPSNSLGKYGEQIIVVGVRVLGGSRVMVSIIACGDRYVVRTVPWVH